MKSTGILRKVDGLGRITLPMELRRSLDISEHDQLEIYLEEDHVILRKNEKKCVFCGGDIRLSEYYGKFVCAECVGSLRQSKS